MKFDKLVSDFYINSRKFRDYYSHVGIEKDPFKAEVKVEDNISALVQDEFRQLQKLYHSKTLSDVSNALTVEESSNISSIFLDFDVLSHVFPGVLKESCF